MFMVMVTGGFDVKGTVKVGLAAVVLFVPDAVAAVVAVVIAAVVESGGVAIEVVEGITGVDAEEDVLGPQPKVDTIKTRDIANRR